MERISTKMVSKMMGRRDCRCKYHPLPTHPMRSLEQILPDSGGNYEFCNLSSDDYYIVVDKSTLPDGYEITSQNQGDDDNNDSDINPDDGKSDTVTISDDNNYSLDGGIYSPTYCLGDMIWKDIDQDGIQDDGEEGVADVNITLYNSPPLRSLEQILQIVLVSMISVT